MEIIRIVPNISSNKMEESKTFYVEFLGLKTAMDMGWIVTFVSEDNSNVQLSIVDSQKPHPSSAAMTITIEVSDIDALYERAVSSAYAVTYPLTEEDWGVRRFFIKDPNGVTINLMSHLNSEQWN